MVESFGVNQKVSTEPTQHQVASSPSRVRSSRTIRIESRSSVSGRCNSTPSKPQRAIRSRRASLSTPGSTSAIETATPNFTLAFYDRHGQRTTEVASDRSLSCLALKHRNECFARKLRLAEVTWRQKSSGEVDAVSSLARSAWLASTARGVGANSTETMAHGYHSNSSEKLRGCPQKRCRVCSAAMFRSIGARSSCSFQN